MRSFEAVETFGLTRPMSRDPCKTERCRHLRDNKVDPTSDLLSLGPILKFDSASRNLPGQTMRPMRC